VPDDSNGDDDDIIIVFLKETTKLSLVFDVCERATYRPTHTHARARAGQFETYFLCDPLKKAEDKEAFRFEAWVRVVGGIAKLVKSGWRKSSFFFFFFFLLLIDCLLALSLSSSLRFLRSLGSSCKESCCSRPRESER
jgi:hypothetical protein